MTAIQREAEQRAAAYERRERIKHLVGDYGLLVVFAGYFVFMALASERFLNIDNLTNVVRQSSIIGLVAIGLTYVMITSGIDLSVGASVGLAAVVSATLASNPDAGLVVPLVAGLLAGLVVGLLNSLLIIRLTILPFLATLAVMAGTRGFALIFTNGQPIGGLNPTFDALGQGYVGPVPIPVLVFAAAAIVGDLILTKTKFGRHVYAVGGNAETARDVGIPVKRVLLRVYLLSSLMAALAGVVLTARVDGADPLVGTGYELDAIAAVVIGGTSLFGGVGTVRGTILGVLLLAMVVNGLNLLNVPSYYQQTIKGGVLVLAVVLNRWKSE
jgi:ribose/xylose/arabinose/galactoside ABC-type transport system permease subunit